MADAETENNPDVMNELAHFIGVTEDFAFHDVYSLDDPEALAMIPRPVYALLVTIPMNPSWKEDRDGEDSDVPFYGGSGMEEPVFWIRQTVIHGCGLIGLLHCAINGLPDGGILPDSKLGDFVRETINLGMDDRAAALNDSYDLHEANETFAQKGDTRALDPDEDSPHHFVALVKGHDGHLWELEGSRKGPLDRGHLEDDEDALSQRALDVGLKRLIRIQRSEGGNQSFSCIALAPRQGQMTA